MAAAIFSSARAADIDCAAKTRAGGSSAFCAANDRRKNRAAGNAGKRCAAGSGAGRDQARAVHARGSARQRRPGPFSLSRRETEKRGHF